MQTRNANSYLDIITVVYSFSSRIERIIVFNQMHQYLSYRYRYFVESPKSIKCNALYSQLDLFFFFVHLTAIQFFLLIEFERQNIYASISPINELNQ